MAVTEDRPVRFDPRTGTYRAAVAGDVAAPHVVEDVPRRTLEPGQIRVEVEACGTCDYCISGWETLCLERKSAGD